LVLSLILGMLLSFFVGAFMFKEELPAQGAACWFIGTFYAGFMTCLIFVH